ncbi:hypothetical protein M409DRAFT_25050 [Zasmidium cellare ATCC 36951]|uniref:Uncharacterized protein n=1 Tax=Zasmidium cellare ATCC 36951 TaxID=1080233 RepID=A0A6A6CGW1_ZASCE|nr:uncharacterized protein M409DRAFT_25050 [Zasmidium cellare ATCC 36951]KAF2164656.1 hypothetical protein M409DRAFT_25050 [Zasmidium cellare ATCC 36951]
MEPEVRSMFKFSVVYNAPHCGVRARNTGLFRILREKMWLQYADRSADISETLDSIELLNFDSARHTVREIILPSMVLRDHLTVQLVLELSPVKPNGRLYASSSDGEWTCFRMDAEFEAIWGDLNCVQICLELVEEGWMVETHRFDLLALQDGRIALPDGHVVGSNGGVDGACAWRQRP